jgi:hypothetical protein
MTSSLTDHFAGGVCVWVFASLSIGLSGASISPTLLSELAARVRWEALWRDSKVAFPEVLPDRAIGVAYLSTSALAFCSLDLERCAYYRMTGGLLGQRIKSAPCTEGGGFCSVPGGAATGVMEFVRSIEGEGAVPRAKGDASPFRGNGERSFSGAWVPVTEVRLTIGSRDSIEATYRAAKPARLSRLRDWLREEFLLSGYQTIEVPCFTDTDPEVIVVGTRGQAGSIVISVRWNAETGQWQSIGFLEESDSAPKLNELRAQIRRISCAVIRFAK